jgi:hypothetical protein
MPARGAAVLYCLRNQVVFSAVVFPARALVPVSGNACAQVVDASMRNFHVGLIASAWMSLKISSVPVGLIFRAHTTDRQFILLLHAPNAYTRSINSHEGEIEMRKMTGAALLLTSGLVLLASPAFALQVSVTSIDKNGDGTATYHFAIRTDQGETLAPDSDFVTVYNFGGLVSGSIKSPAGWSASSPEFGRTPSKDGYPLVLPVDIPALSNVTWTAKKPITGGSQIEGFSATTSVSATTEGEYAAQVTRAESEGSGVPAKTSKQALIGAIPTPAISTR